MEVFYPLVPYVDIEYICGKLLGLLKNEGLPFDRANLIDSEGEFDLISFIQPADIFLRLCSS